MVSMPSLHFFRWAEQLKDAGFKIYWFDSVSSGQKVEKLNWIQQFVDWKLRWDYLGRIFIKKYVPFLYTLIQKINERNIAKEFEKVLEQVQPDIVHSFALYISCSPILTVMKKYKQVKWIYSSWGSDLFYFQNDPSYLKDIKLVLPEIDYMFTDCKRDFEIAKKLGFKGEFLGVFPGGGGFDMAELNKYMLPINERNIILVKGYQGRSGRAISVLKALEKLYDKLGEFKIIVFGADKKVFDYVRNSVLNKWKSFSIYGKISHKKVLELMGKSLIYIGNSNSDGIPNTLIEAICMGTFPIQSNPGRVTEEVIINKKNGFIIQNCEDILEITSLLLKVVKNKELIFAANTYNINNIAPIYSRVKLSHMIKDKLNAINV